MNFTVNEINQSEHEVSIEFSYDEVKNEIDEEVKKQAKKIQLPGFRKGKVPAKLLKSRFGDALEYEAAEKVATDQFWEVAKQNSLKPVGTPSLTDLHLEPGKDLKFKVKYEVIPNIDPKDYTNLNIDIPDYTVSDHEVEHEIEHILKSNSSTEDAEIVGDDEFYIIKVEMQRITESGEVFADSKPETLDIDLSNHHVQPEIRNNVKGKKVGENFEFSFDDLHHKHDVNVEQTMNPEKYYYRGAILEIKKIILPELSEELVKKITKDKISTPEQFKEEIRKDFTNYYQQQTEEFLRRRLITSIISNNDFTPPKSLVQNVLEELIKQEEENGKRRGAKNIDRKLLAERLLPSAQFEVKWFLLKSLIQKKEQLTVTDEELNDLAMKDADKTGIAVEKLINYYKSANMSEKLIDKKLFDFLKEKNNIKKVPPENLYKKEED
ncbi:MAG: trigger factor [Ignavibacteriaceae bacterium]|nr:trigger factor [Ignavibacteriaceae bacterium]